MKTKYSIANYFDDLKTVEELESLIKILNEDKKKYVELNFRSLASRTAIEMMISEAKKNLRKTKKRMNKTKIFKM